MKRTFMIIATALVLLACGFIIKEKTEGLTFPGITIGKETYGQFTVGEKKTEIAGAEVIGADYWTETIMQYVNKNGITIISDDEEAKQDVYPARMGEHGTILVTAHSLEDLFGLAAYDVNTDCLFTVRNGRGLYYGKSICAIVENDTIIRENAYWERIGEADYYDVTAVGELYGYTVKWDGVKSRLLIENTEENAATLPVRYDYRELGRQSVVKDQQAQGTCWAAATTTAIETTLLPAWNMLLSMDHLSLQNAFRYSPEEGGNYTISMSYLTSWKGPVTEEQDPYGDGVSPEGLTAVTHVQEIRLLDRPEDNESVDVNAVKNMVYKYGGAESAIYFDMENQASASAYYQPATYGYYYTGNEVQNHDIVIIGWDDTYPAYNFTTMPPGDGAYICQNSWGSDFGENGVFYVSYYDTKIGRDVVCYTDIESSSNYDRLYQSDLCGWIGQLGYENEKAYFANVYTSLGEENIKAVGFYAVGADTSYEVYVVSDFTSIEDVKLDEEKVYTSGKLEQAGFYTIPIGEDVKLNTGSRFAVIVKVETPGASQPVAVEMQAEEFDMVDISDGEGYISANGINWNHVETEQNCNNCLKVYTKYAQ